VKSSFLSFWNNKLTSLLRWDDDAMAIPVLKRAQQFLRWATVWPQLTWTEKWGGCWTPFCRGSGVPSNTMSPGPSFWSIQPFGYSTPTLQTGQTGEWSRSCIGRTITCNGRPKTAINEARLAPAPKPELEIWRKPRKRARSTRCTQLPVVLFNTI